MSSVCEIWSKWNRVSVLLLAAMTACSGPADPTASPTDLPADRALEALLTSEPPVESGQLKSAPTAL